MRSKGTRGPVLWPILLAVVGIALLLNNFLLLEGFNLTALWPLVLVILGAQMLLRGDIVPSTDSQNFGITRGSVEAAALEVSAGEIDVQIQALAKEGRLIAGQFALNSRPQLTVDETYAHLKLDRSATPWFSFNDWEMGLATDLPWRLYVSTSLGQVHADLSDLIVQDALIATGLGDVRLVCPAESFSPLNVRSNIGSISIITPQGTNSRIHVKHSRMFTAKVDPERYEELETGVYSSRDSSENAPLIEIFVQGSFGDAYLA